MYNDSDKNHVGGAGEVVFDGEIVGILMDQPTQDTKLLTVILFTILILSIILQIVEEIQTQQILIQPEPLKVKVLATLRLTKTDF